MLELSYGPVGDPESRDPFEYAQAHAPEGWHVEGQMFPIPRLSWRDDPRRALGWRMLASRQNKTGIVQAIGWHVEGQIFPNKTGIVQAIGYTKLLAAANLVLKMHQAE